MSLKLEKRKEIITYILQEISRGNKSFVSDTVKNFAITRQSVYKYLLALEDDGVIEVEKNGRANTYLLANKEFRFDFPIAGLKEDAVWRKSIFPLLKDEVAGNVMNACQYGFTEMLNNAIDHSESDNVAITVTKDAVSIAFLIMDTGVGIFNKIKDKYNLEDQRHAILELAKGKCTTDPANHTGEGIFFTSKVFDVFCIMSGSLVFTAGRKNKGNDFLFEGEEHAGTAVTMEIAKDSDVETRKVFDEFANVENGFSKTVIPLVLANYEGGTLVSRSQAKRLTYRFDRFCEIILDFAGIPEIGQGFADELFRVFQNANPKIELLPVNMSPEVEKMVARVLANAANQN